MRDETRRRLERALWIERAKWLGAGLAICLVLAGAFSWINADNAVEKIRVPATVAAVRPAATKGAAASGLLVDVTLSDGRTVEVLVNQITDPQVGQKVEITEHRHATGRTNYSWK